MPPTFAHHWPLDPAVVFLNHGSFGACPHSVLEEQSRLRQEIEGQPVEFFVRRLPDHLDAARVRLGRFLGADPEGLAPVSNATSAVNAVLRSLDLGPGDELLATDHGYNACKNALAFVAARSGARIMTAEIPLPLAGPDEVVDRIVRALTPRTRLALVDHVTSPTGIIFPIRRIVAELERRGVEVLVDGAHGPGMLDLDLEGIRASYYAGNCHKWLCAPKGAGFLWVRADRRKRVHPLTISHGTSVRRPGRSAFHDEFDWTGTDDPTAFLCVPAAIDFVGALVPGGWPEVRRRNRELALRAREILAAALAVEPPCPDEMIGSLAALPLPDGSGAPPATPLFSDALQEVLVRRHGIEVPIVPWPAPPRRLVRISAQLYNDAGQYERLAAALREELGRV